MFNGWGLALKNLFLPIFCHACGRRLMTEENGFFCPACWELSRRIQRPFCTYCGRPHAGATGLFTPLTNFPCAQCREKPPRAIRRIYAAARYEEAIAEAIKLFKFRDKQRLAAPLAECMITFLQEQMDPEIYDRIIPVPLYSVRLRERGYNQSRLLAECILPYFPNARLDESLKRIRPTQTQSTLTSDEDRRANVAGAFAVIDTSFQGQTVLLIDDVVTTGGTASECAVALTRAGAAAVDVFAVAIAGTAS